MDSDWHDVKRESSSEGSPSEGAPPQEPPSEGSSSDISDWAKVVATNNFYRLHLYFDNDGNLRNKEATSFSIRCLICHANVGLTNPHLQESSGEHYAVLRNCGHVIGYKCITNWLLVSQANGKDDLSCPMCRAPVFCDQRHHVPLEIYGRAANMDELRQQIQAIRESLMDLTCEICTDDDPDDAARNLRALSIRNVTTIRAEIEQEAMIMRDLEARLVAARQQRQVQTQNLRRITDANRNDLRIQSSSLPPPPQLHVIQPSPWSPAHPPPWLRNVYYPPPLPVRLPGTSWVSVPLSAHQNRGEQTQAATFPPTAPRNGEDQSGAAPQMFGYPLVQSPNRHSRDYRWGL